MHKTLRMIAVMSIVSQCFIINARKELATVTSAGAPQVISAAAPHMVSNQAMNVNDQIKNLINSMGFSTEADKQKAIEIANKVSGMVGSVGSPAQAAPVSNAPSNSSSYVITGSGIAPVMGASSQAITGSGAVPVPTTMQEQEKFGREAVGLPIAPAPQGKMKVPSVPQQPMIQK